MLVFDSQLSKIYGKGWGDELHHVKVLDWLKANVLPKLPEKDVDVLDFGCGPGITVMTLTGIEKVCGYDVGAFVLFCQGSFS